MRPRTPLISTMGLGTVMPLLRSATGQAFLSAMPREATAHVIRAERDVLGWDDAAIDRLIAETRDRGAAVIEGDIVPGLSAIGAPVFNIDGAIACCVTLMNPRAGYFQPDRPAFDVFTREVAALNRDWSGRPRDAEKLADGADKMGGVRLAAGRSPFSGDPRGVRSGPGHV